MPASPIPNVPATTWLALLTFLIGLATRLIKSETFDTLLHRLKIPSIPRSWIPIIAVALGAADGIVQAVQEGSTWRARTSPTPSSRFGTKRKHWRPRTGTCSERKTARA